MPWCACFLLAEKVIGGGLKPSDTRAAHVLYACVPVDGVAARRHRARLECDSLRDRRQWERADRVEPETDIKQPLRAPEHEADIAAPLASPGPEAPDSRIAG